MSSAFCLRLRRSWGQLPLLLRGLILLLTIAVLAQGGILWHLRRESQLRHKFTTNAAVTFGPSTVAPLVEKRIDQLVPHPNMRLFAPIETALLNETTDDGLESLAEFRGLTELTVRNGLLTEQGMAQIRHLNRLNSLYLESERFAGEALSGLPTCARLQRLKLIGELTPDSLRPLEHCLALTELHLDAGFYEHNGSGRLTKRLTGHHLDAVARIPNLKRLIVCSNDLPDTDLSPLATASQLEELFVNTVTLKRDALKSLGRLPRLKRLVLEVSGADIDAAPRFGEFQALQLLALGGSSVRSSHLTDLRKATHLETLSLQQADLKESLEPITRLSHLRHLNLFLAELPPDGLRQLERMSHLQELCLGLNETTAQISPDELRQKFPMMVDIESRLTVWHQATEIPKWEVMTSGGPFGVGFF